MCRLCIYSMRVKSWQRVCVSVCERVSKREKLLALLIIRRWVFSIGKGELGSDELHVLWMSVLQKSLCLQTYHICACIPGWGREGGGGGSKNGEDFAFMYFLAIFMSDWLYFCIRLSHLSLSVSSSELVCLCVCVRLTGSGDLLFVSLQPGVKPCQAPGEQPQQCSDLSHFLMTHARKHAVLSVTRH